MAGKKQISHLNLNHVIQVCITYLLYIQKHACFFGGQLYTTAVATLLQYLQTKQPSPAI